MQNNPPAPVVDVVSPAPAETPTKAEHSDHMHWQGHDAFDSSGHEVIGTLDNVFVDDATGVATWATVAYGKKDEDRYFVPMAGVRAIGDQAMFAFDLATIQAAPKAGQPTTEAHLSPEDQAALRLHYGLDHQEDPKMVASTYEDGNLTAATVMTETTEEALQHNSPAP